VSDHLIPPQILHVDDDKEALENVRKYLEGEEIPDWGRPQVTSLESFDRALSVLEERRFDLMILDVRLGSYEEENIAPEEEEGSRVLGQIVDRRFLPVIFWTGLPRKVEHLSSPLVLVRDRTAGLDFLKSAVLELFATKLPALNRALRRLVEDEQRRYMWGFVAEHWEELRRGGDGMALAYLLVRRLGRSLAGPGIEQVAAQLGVREHPPTVGTIHAVEMYLIPPLAGTKPSVADLYCETSGDGDEWWWLVVTPSCDLEHDKAEFVVLASCLPVALDSRIRNWRENDNGTNRRKVRDLISQKTGGQDDRTLYLPAAPGVPDLMADFQQLRSVTIEELEGMKRIASLDSPFAEAAVARFTRYFGRVGTEDLDVETIMTRLRLA
jgi:CheY-like chemotaxis protein